MSGFRDYNDEGPGTFEWDYVLGGNTTGLFPEEKHYTIDGDTLTEVFFRHTGGGKYEPFYGDSWTIDNISSLHSSVGADWFTFEQAGQKYKAVINTRFKNKDNLIIVDIKEV